MDFGTNTGNRQRRGPHLTRDRNRSDVPDSPLHEQEQKRALAQDIQHLHGPEEIIYEKDELVVLCLLRDGKPYVRSFIEHYLHYLGARHIVFLDNGSTDGTVEALKEYEGVTVLRSTLPYKFYNVSMKKYLIERFGGNRWTLIVDIDELFEYPYSDVVSLRALLGYLNERGYTAVVTHMLDMFSEKPISEDNPVLEEESLKETYRFYDISGVYEQDYDPAGEIDNVVANEELRILRGGIRNTLFGNNALLMKHPLIFLDDEIEPMDLSDHWVGNARIADFTGVLLHYKLSSGFYEDVRRSVEERHRSEAGDFRYGKFLKVLEQNPTLQIKQDTAKELESVNDLVGTHFMVVSGDYIRFVGEEDRKKGNSPKRHSRRLLDAFLNAGGEARTQIRRASELQWEARELKWRINEDERRVERERQQMQAAQRQLQALWSSRGGEIITGLDHVKKGAKILLSAADPRHGRGSV